MRAVGYFAIFLALFGVVWVWFANGRPRTIEHFIGYLIITAFCAALAIGGGLAVGLAG